MRCQRFGNVQQLKLVYDRSAQTVDPLHCGDRRASEVNRVGPGPVEQRSGENASIESAAAQVDSMEVGPVHLTVRELDLCVC